MAVFVVPVPNPTPEELPKLVRLKDLEGKMPIFLWLLPHPETVPEYYRPLGPIE